MKIKQIELLDIPENLEEILAVSEYWEDDSFEPVLITVQPTTYQGSDLVSYQAEFEPPDSGDELDGDE